MSIALSLFEIYRVRKYDDNKKNWVWTTISEIIYFFLNDHIEFVGKINLKYPVRFLRLQDESDCLLFDYEIVRTCLNEIQDVVVSESSQVLLWRLEWGATLLYERNNETKVKITVENHLYKFGNSTGSPAPNWLNKRHRQYFPLRHNR